MKRILVFLFLISLVVCPLPDSEKEERKKKRKEFQREIRKCILDSGEISAHLRKELEDNKDEDDLRKVLHLFVTKLNENDREVIRKCRREYFSKLRDFHKERIFNKLHRNYTHHLPDEHDDHDHEHTHGHDHDHEHDKNHEGPLHHKHGSSASSPHPSGSAHHSGSVHPSGSEW